ncbi:pre-mRNA-splicing factor 18 [Trichomonascus vanleenenianus]|uniref:mRNA splicing protein PRP18 n=1 Tax=Trichomonascus vanleenenianus TaxID=2268995 RepID=UPI003EC96C51
MDFSAILKGEIAKKKQEANRDEAYGSGGSNKRKLDDVSFRAQERALKKEKRLERERLKKEAERAKSVGMNMSCEEVITMLRKLGEPITFFGETDVDRFSRLKRTERKIEREIKRQADVKAELECSDFTIVPMNVRNDPAKVKLQIRAYIQYLLKIWRESLPEIADNEEEYDEEGIDESQKEARDQIKVYKKSKKFLEPLLQLLRDDNLPKEEMFPSLATLMIHMQKGEYEEAKNTYMKLSIGNAAWPIGVIGVGIHARSALQKISGENNPNKANIMKDEKTKNWLQSLKRLVTFLETH